MSWLNINQSLNSLKGQITNFASEVLSEGIVEDSNPFTELSSANERVQELERKCRNQDSEVSALKQLVDELQSALQAEKLSKKNGVTSGSKEEDASWFWDPSPEGAAAAANRGDRVEQPVHISRLNDEIQHLKKELKHAQEKGKERTRTASVSDATFQTVNLSSDYKNVEEELKYLREENANLTLNLEDLDTQHQLAMDRLLNLKKELQKNFEALKNEHDELKASNEEYSRTAHQQKDLVENLSNKLAIAKSEYDTLHHKYDNLEKVHGILTEDAEKFQEDNQNMHEENFRLQEEISKLQHDLEVANASSSGHNERSRNMGDANDDETNIDDNAKSVIENLKREISDLNNRIKNEESTATNNSNISKEVIASLIDKYVNFDLPVDFVGERSNSLDGDLVSKLENALKTLNNLKKDVDKLEHQLSEKTLNVSHLQTQIDDLTAENDFITSDMAHYERELSEMKKNNDFLISEIATLKNASKLEPIIETHEDNLAKLESELADCNKINKSFESELRSIEKELESAKKEKESLQSDLVDLKAKYNAMLVEMDACQTQKETVREMEENYEEIQRLTKEKLRKSLDDIEDYKKRLNVALAENEKFKIDHHILENEKVLSGKEVCDIKSIAFAKELEIEYRNVEIDELKYRNIELETQIAALNEKVLIATGKDNELLELIENNDRLKTKLEEYVMKNANLEKLNEDLKQDSDKLKDSELAIDKLKLMLNEKIKESFNLTQRLKSANDSLQHLSELEKEKFDLEIKVRLLEKKIEENEEALSEYRTKIENVNSESSENAGLSAEYKKRVADLEMENKRLEINVKELNTKLEESERTAAENQSSVDVFNTEKAELINLVTLKHNENIQYHAEIQRLNTILIEQSTKYNQLSTEHNVALKQISDFRKDCIKCIELNELVLKKESKIEELVCHLQEAGGSNVELSNATETIRVLTEKCEDLDKNLTLQIEDVKMLRTQNQQLSEQSTTLNREVDRLRHHLVAIEETHTQELVASEQRYAESQTRLLTIEDKAKQTSTVYTSNSIRAQQEVETLRSQTRLLEKQRAELQARLAAADDDSARAQAALANLQAVLQQFQADKERDVDSATEHLRIQLGDAQRQHQNLEQEIARINSRLAESNAGLQAAARLGEQLETRSAQLIDMKVQVSRLEASLAQAECRLRAQADQRDRVDKSLVKNLLLGYIHAAGAGRETEKFQALRILSSVLDLNAAECARVGLRTGSSQGPDTGLAREFVRFLERESAPVPAAAPQPSMMGLITEGSRRNSTNQAPSHPPQHKRTPSSGSQNILLDAGPLDNLQTRVTPPPLPPGVSQLRNTEGAILKNVLRDDSV